MSKVHQKYGPKKGLDSLIEAIKGDMEIVNRLIVKKMGSDVALIPDIAGHLVSSGGKRIRPMLTLASARMFGYEGEQHIHLAMAVEFMHTATLLHDDVVDDSDLRRGRATARKIWGNQASVLVGDFLLGQAFKAMVEVGSLKALDILSSAAVLIAEGEVLQLNAVKNIHMSREVYFKIIESKTAVLFSAATEIGPVIAQAGEETYAFLRDYGRYLGIAFQLVDDVLDYAGDKEILGKNIGDDFLEGKITLPIILCYERSDIKEKDFLRSAMEGKERKAADLEKVILLLKRYSCLEEVQKMASDYGDKARKALLSFPETLEKRALLDVVDFCISRLY